MRVCGYMYSVFLVIANCGISRSCGQSVIKLFSNSQTVFHMVAPFLQFYQQCMTVSVSPLLTNTCYMCWVYYFFVYVVCVHVHVCYMYMCIHVRVEVRSWCCVSSSVVCHLRFWCKIFHWTWSSPTQLGWLTSELQ